MPTWPAILPQEPNNGEYKETPPDTVLRFKPDFGPDLVRRRGIAGVRKLSLPYRFSPAQMAAFEDFLKNDLQGGVLSFTFPWPPAPRETKNVTVRLVSMPTYTHKGVGYHDVTLELEVLP
jgi:hypothetical protein